MNSRAGIYFAPDLYIYFDYDQESGEMTIEVIESGEQTVKTVDFKEGE